MYILKRSFQNTGKDGFRPLDTWTKDSESPVYTKMNVSF